MLEASDQEAIIEWLASVSGDPVAFVYGAFPWGEPGPLEHEQPDEWQLGILCDIRDGIIDINTAIKLAVASGHGIGKSALVAWIIWWGFSTMPDTRGRVTAGTETQLKTTTWSEVGKWYNLFIAKDMFVLSATGIRSKDPERDQTWRFDLVPWSESNPQAFAGMHNKGRRIIYIFDEGSAIADIIYETAEGALTDKDTQIIFCVFGNPTKNTGRFRELFPGGRYAKGWKTRNIDSRTVRITNKADIQTKIELYGDDSDYIRIRVTGQFPRTGLMEFFSAADVDAAMAREAISHHHEALVLGVDVARFGSNESVIAPRKGRDARTFPCKRFQGLSTVELAAQVIHTVEELHADGVHIDEGGVGGGVVDNVRASRYHCLGIQFGGRPLGAMPMLVGAEGEKYANMRAEMYGCLRAWMRSGALPAMPELREQLLGITYTINIKDQIILTSKEDMMKDGKPSPDLVDGYALTFAMPVAKNERSGGDHLQKPAVQSEYNPFDAEHMAA